jgi:hypothetical protein
VHEKLRLGPTDRKALTEDVETITWRYALKPDRLPIAPVRHGDLDFLEVDVIQVDVRNTRRGGLVFELLHRAIPYPLILAGSTDEGFAFSLSEKRRSEVDENVAVIERTFVSGWLSWTDRSRLEEAFLDSLAFDSIRADDFRQLYSAYVQRIVSLRVARRTSRFDVNGRLSIAEAARLLDDVDRLDIEIAAERRKLSEETHFNRKVEMSSRIKSLETKRRVTLKGLETEN